ncbi:MAG: 4Fe-4S dicluster domain-containing protein [Proteobacteria bacterium]|nr:4Fe-4S dicluster domain-containing protein [Pseudomonadota bacterium]
MTITQAHIQLAEKFMHKQYWESVIVPESLKSLVALAYTEEEAQLVHALSFANATAGKIARLVKRPVGEVRPMLESLSDRLLITGLKIKGIQTYGFMNFVPGLFEVQMIRSKNEEHNEDTREFFVEFAALFHEFYEEIMPWLKDNLAGKDVRFMRIIPVGKSLQNLGGVIPVTTDSFQETIDRNNSFCLVDPCACRQEMHLLGEGCDKPRDVCSAMGWLADYCIEKGLARRVSKEEYIDAKTRAAEAGLVNMTDNLANPMQVCSCCACCCGALRMLRDYSIPTIVAGSRFESAVDSLQCNACGKCSQVCPMKAIEWKKKQPPVRINYARCIGCGLCVAACDKQKAMSLRERQDYTPPSKTVFDYYADRYLEVKGNNVSFGPQLKLGIGRMISRVSPFSLSGPGYKSPK